MYKRRYVLNQMMAVYIAASLKVKIIIITWTNYYSIIDNDNNKESLVKCRLEWNIVGTVSVQGSNTRLQDVRAIYLDSNVSHLSNDMY